jgi:hypothetical protein
VSSAKKKHIAGANGSNARLTVVASAIDALKSVPQKTAARNAIPRPSVVPATLNSFDQDRRR